MGSILVDKEGRPSAATVTCSIIHTDVQELLAYVHTVLISISRDPHHLLL